MLEYCRGVGHGANLNCKAWSHSCYVEVFVRDEVSHPHIGDSVCIHKRKLRVHTAVHNSVCIHKQQLRVYIA